KPASQGAPAPAIEVLPAKPRELSPEEKLANQTAHDNFAANTKVLKSVELGQKDLAGKLDSGFEKVVAALKATRPIETAKPALTVQARPDDVPHGTFRSDPLAHEKLDDLNRRLADVEKGGTSVPPARATESRREIPPYMGPPANDDGKVNLWKVVAAILVVGFGIWWFVTPNAVGKHLFAGSSGGGAYAAGGAGRGSASDAAVEAEFRADCAKERGKVYTAAQWNAMAGANLFDGQLHCNRPAGWSVDPKI
ncbi:MAG: hypothetical protein Q7R41_12815, partial [Phycisphaerales bacterium]|nr:hypothetical protein [Phycisphaerales bacterium]